MGNNMYLIEKIEGISIEKVYESLKDKPYTMILDSSLKESPFSKYSIVAFEPFLVFRSKGWEFEVEKDGIETKSAGDPLEALRRLLDQYPMGKNETQFPFISGAVGYFSYDFVRCIEKIPEMAREDVTIPDMVLGFYNQVLVYDLEKEEAFLCVSSVGREENPDRDNQLMGKIKELQRFLGEEIQVAGKPDAAPKKVSEEPLVSNFTEEEYCKMIAKAREYIRNGDLFQVNLSQRFKVKINRHPYEIYKEVRHHNPAPFSAYLDCEDVKVLSSSPERFIRVTGRRIETRPIKGTRPRGRNASEDEALRKELLESGKDTAELVMIVDVERNDLGRICKIGSVDVKSLREIEAYATVFHAVSTIVGELKDGIHPVDCLKAMFPSGSITGAPKIRSMEIIDELEPNRRNIYTGSIGYIGFDGHMDLNIAIRTITIKDGEAFYQVGGGIVWDSVPEKEYQETLDKGKALRKVLSS